MPSEPYVSVVGVGSETGAPDRFTLQLGVKVTSDTAAEAVSECARLMRRALDALHLEGIEEANIRTTYLTVEDFFERHEPSRSKPRHIGNYQFQVNVPNVESVGGLMSALASVIGNALQVGGIEQSISDPEPLKMRSRELAVRDASARATELAETAGCKLGPVLSIEEVAGPSGLIPKRAMASRGPALGPTIPVEQGLVTVTSYVNIVYALSKPT